MLRRASQAYIPNAMDLELICDAGCTASLEALRDTQIAKCFETDAIVDGDIVYPATYLTDLMLHTYKWACLTDS